MIRRRFLGLVLGAIASVPFLEASSVGSLFREEMTIEEEWNEYLVRIIAARFDVSPYLLQRKGSGSSGLAGASA